MVAPHKTDLQRHDRNFPCPVCGGHSGLPQGRGVRCAGFTVGIAAFCTREQFAGSAELDINTEPPAYKHILLGMCGCGTEHGFHTEHKSIGAHYSVSPPQLNPGTQHAIYSAVLDHLTLRVEAQADLTRRGLIEEDILSVKYRSLPRRGPEVRRFVRALVDRFGESVLRTCPGFVNKNGQTYFPSAGGQDGYLVPYRDEEGLIRGLQIKLLGAKYLTLRLAQTGGIYHLAGAIVPGSDLFLTEGGLKAQVAHRLGEVTVMGVPGQALSEEHVQAVERLRPGRVIVALDEERNVNTDRARERWLKTLFHAGLPTFRAVWEGEDVGGPKGLDDLLQAGLRPRIRSANFAPAGIGERRFVRATKQREEVPQGISLASARHATEEAIFDFIEGKRR